MVLYFSVTPEIGSYVFSVRVAGLGADGVVDEGVGVVVEGAGFEVLGYGDLGLEGGVEGVMLYFVDMRVYEEVVSWGIYGKDWRGKTYGGWAGFDEECGLCEPFLGSVQKRHDKRCAGLSSADSGEAD